MRQKLKKFIKVKGAGVGGKIKILRGVWGGAISSAEVDSLIRDIQSLTMEGKSSGKGLFIPGRPLDTQIPKGKGLFVPGRPIQTQIPTGGAVKKSRPSLSLSSDDYKAKGKGLKRT